MGRTFLAPLPEQCALHLLEQMVERTVAKVLSFPCIKNFFKGLKVLFEFKTRMVFDAVGEVAGLGLSHALIVCLSWFCLIGGFVPCKNLVSF